MNIDPRISGKTGVVATSAAAATALIYVVGLFGVELPGEVAAGIVALIAALLNWLIPAKSGSHVVEPDSEPVEEAPEYVEEISLEIEEV